MVLPPYPCDVERSRMIDVNIYELSNIIKKLRYECGLQNRYNNRYVVDTDILSRMGMSASGILIPASRTDQQMGTGKESN
jgi:hypothetical protein